MNTSTKELNDLGDNLRKRRLDWGFAVIIPFDVRRACQCSAGALDLAVLAVFAVQFSHIRYRNCVHEYLRRPMHWKPGGPHGS